MAVINSIEFLVAEGNETKVHKMMRDPKGLPLTRSQKGCQRVELSVDIEDSNRFFLTEVWDEKSDFDAYFAIRAKELEEGGFFSKLVPLLAAEPKMTLDVKILGLVTIQCSEKVLVELERIAIAKFTVLCFTKRA